MIHQPTRPRSRLTRLEHDLASVLGEDNIGPMITITRLRKLWPEIVGPMMASHTEPVRIEDYADGRRLWVAVDHSIIAQQIRMLRKEIILACHRRFHISGLSQIRTQMLAGAGIRRESYPEVVAIPLHVRRSIAISVRHVNNDKLRRAIFKARLAQLTHAENPSSVNPEGKA